ncbi:hypothetical protein D0Y65_045755 [Glycine soja]|uniref:Uncharacterized protein n=1 Tax=Glycine soja TaxID=3848 RepID=A0A445G6G0_GLYSO|nr:hypothetical protein D0Y65_045755 [Glycine soja]
MAHAVFPELLLLTEYMVDMMKCEGCVSAVKNKLNEINGKCSGEVFLLDLSSFLIVNFTVPIFP